MWDSDNDRGQMDSFKAFAGVEDGTPPTLRDNIKYFTNYQFGFMYLRYFLWNFAGKQNDLQGFGNVRDGNFSTGISFIDNFPPFMILATPAAPTNTCGGSVVANNGFCFRWFLFACPFV